MINFYDHADYCQKGCAHCNPEECPDWPVGPRWLRKLACLLIGHEPSHYDFDIVIGRPPKKTCLRCGKTLEGR